MARRKTVSKRRWLAPSDPDSFAYVNWSQDKYDERDAINIKIADCNRCINLYFEGRKGLKKLDRLLAMLEEARGHLEERVE